MTNDNQRVVGVISLSDILKHLVISPLGLDAFSLANSSLLATPLQQTPAHNILYEGSQQLSVVTELSSSPSCKEDASMEVDVKTNE